MWGLKQQTKIDHDLICNVVKNIYVETNDENAEDKYILELYKIFVVKKIIYNDLGKNLTFEELLNLNIEELEEMHDKPIIEIRNKSKNKDKGFLSRWFNSNSKNIK
jgi:hypothetical protein